MGHNRRIVRRMVGFLFILIICSTVCSGQSAKPSDLQSVGGFLDFCDLRDGQTSKKTAEAMGNLPPGDVIEAIKKVQADALANLSLCLGYVNGLYEGWKEGHDHGVMATHLHSAVPLDWRPALKSMSAKELDILDAEIKTDVPCVPDRATFGDLRGVVAKYLREEVKKNSLSTLALTSHLFPYALRAAFPCPAGQPVKAQGASLGQDHQK